jgi:DNA-binding MarR family transcriptional regulator
MRELPTSPVYLLKRAELAVRGCVEKALGEVALTPSQYFVLFLVETGEATSSAELARATGVLPQSMTELISLLEKRGLIARTPDNVNSRILRIEVTAAGRKLFEKGTEVAIRLERELFEEFTPREVDTLNGLFSRLIASAERHSYHPKLRGLPRAAAKSRPASVARKATPGRRAAARS